MKKASSELEKFLARKAFNKKATIVESLAKEIMAAAANSGESYAIGKKNDAEKQADAAR